jgi:hypothetical protein
MGDYAYYILLDAKKEEGARQKQETRTLECIRV